MSEAERKIRRAAGKAVIYTQHAAVQMDLEERLITTEEVNE